ncbi:MAG: GNAT family N-acetyltransferase [Candidatus Nealsonbacteria bacterium]|nr:GNAT family N-acetyltransferase [Candidatus Nealsonbacteria bacterium]
MAKIRPLSKKRLNEAVNLLNEVFPSEEEEPPSEELPASLNEQEYKSYLSRTTKSDVKYWLAVDDSGRVAGTVGLYCYEKDKNEAFWLGWFCVRPDCRRKGIGEKLLRFAINKAKRQGKTFLRLDTSTDPDELTARRLYEKYGFKLIGRGPHPDASIEKLYYELKL